MIKDLFISLFIIPLAVNWLIDYSGLILKFKFWLFYRINDKSVSFRPFRIRPIDCEMCMGVWSALAYLYFTGSVLNRIDMILVSLAAGAVSFLITKLNK